MNFTQWKKYAEKNDVSKITYICGSEGTLRELVLEDIKNILEIDSINFTESTGNTVWEDASRYPLDPSSNRLTVVRNAEKIDSWLGLAEWISQSRQNTKNYVVFISSDEDAPSIFAKGKRVGYSEHIETIRSKGKLIKCSQPNPDDLIAWCQSFGLSYTSAEYLIERTSADVAAMYNVLRKVKVWNGSPNANAIKVLCQERVDKNSFCDYLILGDKKSAYAAIKNMSDEDKLKVVTKLDILLDSLLDINRCLARRMYDTDIASATGIKIFTIKKFKNVAKDYTSEKVKQRRQVITLVDYALQSAILKGAMERLITLW